MHEPPLPVHKSWYHLSKAVKFIKYSIKKDRFAHDGKCNTSMTKSPDGVDHLSSDNRGRKAHFDRVIKNHLTLFVEFQ